MRPSEARLIPPAIVLRRFGFDHVLHQRFLVYDEDDPRRAAYNAEFWDDLVEAGLATPGPIPTPAAE